MPAVAGGSVNVASLTLTPGAWQLTYSNVTATLALIVALGGTSYAVTALPRDSVDEAQLKRDGVGGRKANDGTAETLDSSEVAG